MKKKVFISVLSFIVFTVFSFAGIQWKSTMTVKAKSNKASNRTVAQVYAQNGDVKQVFKEVDRNNQVYGESVYWLYKAKERKMYVVNTKEKEYTVMSLDQLTGMAGAMGSMVKIKVSDHKISRNDLGTETVAGYKCNHVKLHSKYTMKMKVVFVKKTYKVETFDEIWGTKSIRGLKHISSAYLNSSFKTGIKDIDKLIEKQVEGHKGIGFPVKTVTTSINRNKKGTKVVGKTVTTRINSEFKTKSFPASFFEVPKDYKMNDMYGAQTSGKNSKKKKKKKKFGLF